MPTGPTRWGRACVARAALMLALLSLAPITSVAAGTFRWAGNTDPTTLDPHATNTAPVLGFLNNVYEGLVRRGKDMSIEPALATHWEALGKDGWRFTLRKGVRFHGGQAFDADDVLFSYQRASAEGSDVRSWFAPVSEVRVIDAHTIDFLTNAPNPLFPDSIANFMILDRGWAEANAATRPSRDTGNHATLNENGTGAFRVVERAPGIRTVLRPFDGWWGNAEHNLTEAVFTPIDNPATLVAALLSGAMDFVEPIPLQDVARVAATPGLSVHQGIEARVIMFGFAHRAERLRYSAFTGPNPLRDRRVRQAIYQAIDVEALIGKIMRGNAQPAGLLIAPGIRGFEPADNTRLPYDPATARKLLAEAGHGNGFALGLACPNDRYINDEAICTAAVSMLARVGLEARLHAMPVRGYWGELRAGNFDMYLLGWSPGTFDAEHPIRFLVHTPDPEKKLGSWNFGGFSHARIDALLPQIQVELDDRRRQAMIDEVHAIMREEVAYVPLHVQPLVWGSRDNVTLTQRADNFLILRWVRMN